MVKLKLGGLRTDHKTLTVKKGSLYFNGLTVVSANFCFRLCSYVDAFVYRCSLQNVGEGRIT